MAIPEHQPQQSDSRGISIARLISSEFGSAETVIRQQLGHRLTEIYLDGDVWDGDRFFIPHEKLVGKVIEVVAPERHWRFAYPESK